MGTTGSTLQDHVSDPLPRLYQQLESEYDGIVPRDVIDRAAEQALHELDDARIREFVQVFAWRRARAVLRRVSWVGREWFLALHLPGVCHG